MKLVIVESPSKAKTIEKYLGKEYKVLASYGHVRNIPSKQASIDTDKNFAISWEDSPKATKSLRAIKEATKIASEIFLATDPDREGEAISWHLEHYLKEHNLIKKTVPVRRVVFNSITKDTILKAFEQPRSVDQKLVDAYLARISLDYLVGFNISPILWHKLPGSKSAGRVQSVALRLICDKENEREDFLVQEYWSLEANLHSSSDPDHTHVFKASPVKANGTKLDKMSISNEEEAHQLKEEILKGQPYEVAEVTEKELSRNPYAPFTTSSLQQDAFNRLGFSAKKTMNVAQKLYEGVRIKGHLTGLITYIRTDATDIEPAFLYKMRSYIEGKYGTKYLNKSVRVYKTKTKNAQEAHEAIRPTNINYPPEEVKKYLGSDEFALYQLIWGRTLASQMASAKYNHTAISILGHSSDIELKASGSVLNFAGFYKVYGSPKEVGENQLLALKKDDILNVEKVEALQHFTEPPARYSEATLVKTLEELGIGRPSTYAGIIAVLTSRGYATIKDKRFHPSERGRILNSFLTKFFTKYVDYTFTSSMEEDLDRVSHGSYKKLELLNNFWQEFKDTTTKAKDISPAAILDAVNASLASRVIGSERTCPTCHKGELLVKYSRFGAFVGCSCYPECHYIRSLNPEEDLKESSPHQDKEIGLHPDTGNPVILKFGPYGPYLETLLPAPVKKKPSKTTAKSTKAQKTPKPKFKRVPVPKSLEPNDLTLEQALFLLSMPALVEGTTDIYLGIGRFGPYLKQGDVFYSLKIDNIFNLTSAQAIKVIEEGKLKKQGLEIGLHPKLRQIITLHKSRFGSYLQCGGIKVKLPTDYKNKQPTLEEAVTFLAQVSS